MLSYPAKYRNIIGCVLLIWAIAANLASAAPARMTLLADARNLPRKLLHSEISLIFEKDTVAILYPRWIPGLHGPRGPINNLCRFAVRDVSGQEIEWRRDWRDPFRFFVYPGGPGKIGNIYLSYICSQDYTGVGNPSMGTIDWNTIAVYPEGTPIDSLEITARLILPPGWNYASALPEVQRNGDTVIFAPVSLETLVDMPVLCGKYMKTMQLAATPHATYFLDLAADRPEDLPGDTVAYVQLTKMLREAESLFSGTPFRTYHLLAVVSDYLFQGGLEHGNSSLNYIFPSDLTTRRWSDSKVSELIPHEFVHAWCGKYRRPAGMITGDYMTPPNMDLLWVYEGLTQYLGQVLAVRSGLLDSERWRQQLAMRAAEMVFQHGRRWRSLRDTEVSSGTVWGGPPYWNYLRRGPDYYNEGAFIWMEIDARIRAMTDGKKSLDNFCAEFFSQKDSPSKYLPFTYGDIIAGLNAVRRGPWDSLITARLNRTEAQFDRSGLERCGYNLVKGPTKSEELSLFEAMYNLRNFGESVGFMISGNGQIYEIVPESPADSAGLYPGLTILKVDGADYTHELLENAIRQSPENDSLRLTVSEYDNAREIVVAYRGGLKYMQLERIKDRPDYLSEIARPRLE